MKESYITLTADSLILISHVGRYVHNGRYGVRDVVKLDITDNHKNSQLDKRFYVTVEPIDMVYPEMVNRGVELSEANR